MTLLAEGGGHFVPIVNIVKWNSFVQDNFLIYFLLSATVICASYLFLKTKPKNKSGDFLVFLVNTVHRVSWNQSAASKFTVTELAEKATVQEIKNNNNPTNMASAADMVGMAFVPYYYHLMELLKSSPQLRETAKGIFKQVAWGAAGTIAGGAIGGPVGAMVGGVMGSIIGYKQSDHYDSLIVVLQELTDEEKKELVSKVQALVGSSSVEALTRFIGTQAQRSALLNLLQTFTDGSKK